MILHVDNISKTLNSSRDGRTFTLNIDSLEVEQNDVTSVLGPNGSGKSTFIKLILNLLFIEHGTITVFGIDHTLKQARQKISYLPENYSFPKNFTIREMLELFGDINGHDPDKRYRQINRMAEAFNVDYLDKKIKELSKGMRQVAALMLTFLGDREFYLLDEPFNGLDATQKKAVLDYLFDRRQEENMTILITTHILSDVDKFCDHIHLIRGGKIIHSSTKAEIYDQFASVEHYYHNHIN